MAVMIKPTEILENLKQYYCLAGVYLDFIVQKVTRNELDYTDQDYIHIETKLHELKVKLHETAISINPSPATVGTEVSIPEYLDLLQIKNLSEDLDIYLDSILYYNAKIMAEEVCQ